MLAQEVGRTAVHGVKTACDGPEAVDVTRSHLTRTSEWSDSK